MASSSDNVYDVSHHFLMMKDEINNIEPLNDKDNGDMAGIEPDCSNFKEFFYTKLVEYDQEHQGSRRKPWTLERIMEVINEIKKAKVTMSTGQRRKPMEYYWMGKYDVINIAGEDYLIFKKLTPTDSMVRIVPREQYFDILTEIHESCGHGGRDKMLNDIKNKYYIPKKAVEMFVSLCPTCGTKRNVPRKSIVTRPLVSRDFNTRGLVYLIDFQSCPDGDYKWLLKYQDDATKFLNLRPLKTREAVEVASELLKIFLTHGPPYILQSDNGREFIANVITELAAIWPDCKIVHTYGSPRHTQAEDKIEQSDQDVKQIIQGWMNKNKCTNWSVGCFFVQYRINTSFNSEIKKSPYKALFGSDPKVSPNESDMTASLFPTIEIDAQSKRSSNFKVTDGLSTND